ncbi:unnamed protein product [Acanthoscelides obtectus]|uniref:C2H2-type domain-containing protein n=1 Tax=Acanthoscelides obtectus TaxID=200917 RepID=A0A9P0JJE9_ACAOB|nr:unnamed protein product [Acanthoscelides obtectus]CAK1639666.1 hypothetical protein AOBTE_LOCUS11301 [Acanthoscelides obtectus]
MVINIEKSNETTADEKIAEQDTRDETANIPDLTGCNKTEIETSNGSSEPTKRGAVNSKKRGKISTFMRGIKNRISKVIGGQKSTKTKQKMVSKKDAKRSTRLSQVNFGNDVAVDNTVIAASLSTSLPCNNSKLNQSLLNEETAQLSLNGIMEDTTSSGQFESEPKPTRNSGRTFPIASEKTDIVDSSADEASFVAPSEPVKRRSRRSRAQISSIPVENSESDLSSLDNSDSDASKVDVLPDSTGDSMEVIERRTLRRVRANSKVSDTVDTTVGIVKSQSALPEKDKTLESFASSSPIGRTSINDNFKLIRKPNDTSDINNSIQDVQNADDYNYAPKSAETVQTKSIRNSTEHAMSEPDSDNSTCSATLDNEEPFIVPIVPIQTRFNKRGRKSKDLNRGGNDADHVSISGSDEPVSVVNDILINMTDKMEASTNRKPSTTTAELLQVRLPKRSDRKGKAAKSPIEHDETQNEFADRNKNGQVGDQSVGTAQKPHDEVPVKDENKIMDSLSVGNAAQQDILPKRTRKSLRASDVDSCTYDSCESLNSKTEVRKTTDDGADIGSEREADASTEPCPKRSNRKTKLIKTSGVESSVTESCESLNEISSVQTNTFTDQSQKVLSKRTSPNVKQTSDNKDNVSNSCKSLNYIGLTKDIGNISETHIPDVLMKLPKRGNRKSKLSETSDVESNILDSCRPLNNSDMDITTKDDKNIFNVEKSEAIIEPLQTTLTKRSSGKFTALQTSDLKIDGGKTNENEEIALVETSDASIKIQQVTLPKRGSRKIKLSKSSDIGLGMSEKLESLLNVTDEVNNEAEVSKVNSHTPEKIILRISKTDVGANKTQDKASRSDITKSSISDSVKLHSDVSDLAPPGQDILNSEKNSEEPFVLPLKPVKIKVSRRKGKCRRRTKVSLTKAPNESEGDVDPNISDNVDSFSDISASDQSDIEYMNGPMKTTQRISRSTSGSKLFPEKVQSDASDSCETSDFEKSDENSLAAPPIKTTTKKRRDKMSLNSKCTKASTSSVECLALDVSDNVPEHLDDLSNEKNDAVEPIQWRYVDDTKSDVVDTGDLHLLEKGRVLKRSSKARKTKVPNNPSTTQNVDAISNINNIDREVQDDQKYESDSEKPVSSTPQSEKRITTRRRAKIPENVCDDLESINTSIIELSNEEITEKSVNDSPTESLSCMPKTELSDSGAESIRRKLPQRRAKESKPTQDLNTSLSSSNDESTTIESDISNRIESSNDMSNNQTLNPNNSSDVSCEASFVTPTRRSKRSKISENSIDTDRSLNECSDKETQNFDAKIDQPTLEDVELHRQNLIATMSKSSSSLDTSLELSTTEGQENDKSKEIQEKETALEDAGLDTKIIENSESDNEQHKRKSSRSSNRSKTLDISDELTDKKDLAFHEDSKNVEKIDSAIDDAEASVIDSTVASNGQTTKATSIVIDQTFIAPIEPIQRKPSRKGRRVRSVNKQNVIDSSASEDNESSEDNSLKNGESLPKRRSTRTKEQAAQNLNVKTSESESSEDSRDMISRNDMSDSTSSLDNCGTENFVNKPDPKIDSEILLSDFLDQRVTRKMKKFINGSYDSTEPQQIKNEDLIEKSDSSELAQNISPDNSFLDTAIAGKTVENKGTKLMEKIDTRDTMTETQKPKRANVPQRKCKFNIPAVDVSKSESVTELGTPEKYIDLRNPSDILHQLIENKLDQLQKTNDTVDITKQMEHNDNLEVEKKNNVISKRRGKPKTVKKTQKLKTCPDIKVSENGSIQNIPNLTKKTPGDVFDQLKQSNDTILLAKNKVFDAPEGRVEKSLDDVSHLEASFSEPEDPPSRDIESNVSESNENFEAYEDKRDTERKNEKAKLKPESNVRRSRSAPMKKAKKFTESRFRSKSPKKCHKSMDDQTIEDAITDDSGIEKSIDNSVTELDNDVFERPRNLRKKPHISYVEPDIMHTPRREDSDVISIFDLYDMKRFTTFNRDVSAKKQVDSMKKSLTTKKADLTADVNEVFTNPLISTLEPPDLKDDGQKLSYLGGPLVDDITQTKNLPMKDIDYFSEEQTTLKTTNEEPIRIVINKQKTRRKSRSFKKTDLKGPNDLYEDFALVIKKPKKGVTPIIRFSPADTFLKDTDTSDVKLPGTEGEQNLLEPENNLSTLDGSNEDNTADVSVEEMDMELDEIPIPPKIIETEKLAQPSQIDEINNGTKNLSKKNTKCKRPNKNKNKMNTAIPYEGFKLSEAGNSDNVFFEPNTDIENKKIVGSFVPKFKEMEIPDVLRFGAENVASVAPKELETRSRRSKRLDPIVDPNIQKTEAINKSGEVDVKNIRRKGKTTEKNFALSNRDVLDEKLAVVEKELDSTIDAVLQATNVFGNEFENTLDVLDKIIPDADINETKVKNGKSNRKSGKTGYTLDGVNIENNVSEQNVRSNLRSMRNKKSEEIISVLTTTIEQNPNNSDIPTKETKSRDESGRANSSEYENMVDIFENELMRGIQIDQHTEKRKTRSKRGNKKSEKEMETTIHNVLEATSVFDNALGNLIDDIEHQIIPELKESAKIDSVVDIKFTKEQSKGRELEDTVILADDKLQLDQGIDPVIDDDTDDDLDDEFVDVMKSESTPKTKKWKNYDGEVEGGSKESTQEAFQATDIESECTGEVNRDIPEVEAGINVPETTYLDPTSVIDSSTDIGIEKEIVGKRILRGRFKRTSKKSKQVVEALGITDEDKFIEPKPKSKSINKVASSVTNDLTLHNVSSDKEKGKTKDVDSIYAFSESEDLEIEKPAELPLRLPRKCNITTAPERPNVVDQKSQKVATENKELPSENTKDITSLEEKIRWAIKKSLIEQSEPEKIDNENAFNKKSDLCHVIELNKISLNTGLSVQHTIPQPSDIDHECIPNIMDISKSYNEVEVRSGNRRARNAKNKKTKRSVNSQSVPVETGINHRDGDQAYTKEDISGNIDGENLNEEDAAKDNDKKSEVQPRDFFNTSERSNLDSSLVDDISINNIDEDFLNKIESSEDILDEIYNEIDKNDTSNEKGNSVSGKTEKLIGVSCLKIGEVKEIGDVSNKVVANKIAADTVEKDIGVSRYNASKNTRGRVSKKRGGKSKIIGDENSDNIESRNAISANTGSDKILGHVTQEPSQNEIKVMAALEDNKKSLKDGGIISAIHHSDQKTDKPNDVFDISTGVEQHLLADNSDKYIVDGIFNTPDREKVILEEIDREIEESKATRATKKGKKSEFMFPEIDPSELPQMKEQTDKIVESVLDQIDKDACILAEIDKEIDESKNANVKTKKITKRKNRKSGSSLANDTSLINNHMSQEKPVEASLIENGSQSMIETPVEPDLNEKPVDKNAPSKKRSHSEIFETEPEIEPHEESLRKRSVRTAKVKALEHIHDDALAELTDSEINRQTGRKKVDEDTTAGVKNTKKQAKNKLLPVIDPLSFPKDILQEKAPLLADLVADLAGLEELRNSIERELRAENDLEEVEEPKQLDEENLELRRSRRNSRKVASYNENELDPILDALENKNSTKKKETVVKENKANKDTEKRLNSDALFSMLKASTTDETLDPKPQNSFLNNLEDNSRELNDQSFDNVFDNLIEKSTLLIKANANRNSEKQKDPDKIYEFTDSPETESLPIVEDCMTNKSKRPSQCITPSIKIPSDENESISLEPPVEVTDKVKTSEKNSDNYCEICNKSFVRVESLVKHKRTITHIQKLSEIEAREASEKQRAGETQQDAEVDHAPVADDTPNIDTAEKESLVEPVSASYSDSMKLDDSVSRELQKPFLEGNEKFVDIIMKSSAEIEPKYKRYKSLGERKSFESESSVPADSISEPYLISKTSILEKQISLLENIIENRTGVSYVDDISVTSTNSEMRATSTVDAIKTVNDSERGSKRTCDDSFLKPAQYEEISEDSANLRNYEEQKLRKTLNRDEELFLECCSLLKSGSEVSKSRHAAWSKDKSVPHKPPFEEANESSNGNSRIATPLGSSYDDDASDSNTISSNWGLRNETTKDLKRDGDKSKILGFRINEEEREALNRENEISKPLNITPSENAKPDELLDAKKFVTKGARKVFEGLKVSIPTEELNMEEVLSTGQKCKKGDDVEKMEDVPKKASRKSKPVKKAQVGSNLMFKVNKKKGSPNTNIVIQSEEPETNLDVYDFEETQDNTEVFTKPDFKAFKSVKPTDLQEPIAEPTDQESDTDSRDYLDTFTVERDSSVSSLASSVVKKPKAQENITKKKCMIMGRIFKNAAKSKVEDIDEDIRAIPPIDNDELIENYVASCKRVIRNESKPKLSESEINLLFDQLLEDKIESKEGEQAEPEAASKPAPPTAPPVKPKQESKEVNKKLETKKKPSKMKGKKRARTQSDSTDDEFKITNTSKRSYKKTAKEEDSCINLELELKECIGVASRKSQRKCTSGKQNVLVEYWSSDESQFEAMLESQKITTKTIADTEPPQTMPEPEEKPIVENKPDPVIEQQPAGEKPPKERKVQSKKTVTAKKKKQRPKGAAIRDEVTKEAMEGSAAQTNRRKRAATNPLYHWSSSSEDESQDLIEVKPIRDEPEDDEDRPIQHGWIVGDSPKKLVTMLAQAKGKKTDTDTVKEQGKKRTASSAVS